MSPISRWFAVVEVVELVVVVVFVLRPYGNEAWVRIADVLLAVGF